MVLQDNVRIKDELIEKMSMKKGTYGWLKEQAKKDGFENIRDWQNWKRDKVNKQVKRHEFGQSWTKEKILECFRRFYEKKGKVPIVADFDSNHKCPNHSTVRKIFGSWNNAIEEAGLWNKRYNDDNICEFIEENGKRCTENLDRGNARQFNTDGKLVWYCSVHGRRYYQKNDPGSWNNIRKTIANCRTGNQDPNHECTKGDITIDVVCKDRDWENLNKIYNKYNIAIDCRDKKTGSLHQVQGRSLSILRTYITTKGEERYNEGWIFDFKREWKKRYKSIICVCKSKDGKKIEEIYEFPFEVIKEKTCITITKNPKRIRKGDRWYGQYKVSDEEIKIINEIS